MRPYLLALLLASCGVIGGSAEDQQALTRYRQNAALYYDGGKLEQAMAMIERGLRIDRDDYKLNTMRAYILLRRSQDDEALLDQALQAFQKVMAMRSDYEHGPDALLGYAMTLQALGMRHQSESDRLLEAARRTGESNPEAEVLRSQANEHRAMGRSFLLSARKYLDILLERGELVLLAHYHHMQVATALKDYEETFRHGAAYLEEIRRARQIEQRRLENTSVVAYEREVRARLQKLREQEILVRTYLADIHYKLGQYADAVAHLDIVLQMDPTRSADYYNRGRCLRELGRIEAAKADFRKFLATSPLPAGNPKKTDAVKALESH